MTLAEQSRTAGHDPASAPVAAVTGYAVHVPGVDLPGFPEPACAAADAAELLGRKGLLAKDQATRLALCAVHRALGRAPRAPRPTGAPDPGTAVVVSSNLGNVGTVSTVARSVRDTGLTDVSPLDAPNVSSNVVASTVAIWFRFGGPNLMVCSGATAGLDAIWLAGLLLRAGRAERVVVVGTEPDDPDARALHAARAGARPGAPLLAGAACLLLEPVATAGQPLALLGPVDLTPAAPEPPDLTIGDPYGAAGVLYTALAVAAGTATVSCGDPVDGWRGMELTDVRKGR
jgi:hypothetical protein